MKKFVFVLMPFSPAFDDIYKLGIKSACEAENVYCERVDEQFFEGSMLDRIYNQINHADYIIADTTTKNPNVFYETGYAHALEKKVILITQDGNDIPFDMKHFAHTIYEKDKISLLKESIQKKLKWYLNNDADAHNKSSIQFDVYFNENKLELEKPNNVIMKFNRTYDDNLDEIYVGELNISINNPTEEYYSLGSTRLSIKLPKALPVRILAHNKCIMKNIPGDFQILDFPTILPSSPQEWNTSAIRIYSATNANYCDGQIFIYTKPELRYNFSLTFQ